MSEYYKILTSNKNNCFCGGFYKYYNFSHHIKTKKHINYINLQNKKNISFIINIID